jgi:multidrug efflux pump subunit AcrB
VPPPVRELGNSSGFDVEMEDRGGLGHDAMMKARNQFLALAARDPLLSGVRPNGSTTRRNCISTSIRKRRPRSAFPSPTSTTR